MPFTSDDDTPWWVREGLEELPATLIPDPEVLPELPPELASSPLPDLEPTEDCPCCTDPTANEPVRVGLHHAPEHLADRFTHEWQLREKHTARAWRVIAAMHAAIGRPGVEFLGDDLALLTNTHPLSGQHLGITGLQACAVPELVTLVESGQLGSKHVETLLGEVGKWTDEPAQATRVLQLTLERCRDRAALYGWPTPAALRKRLQTAAILLDLRAADKHRKSVAERRSATLSQSGLGAAMLTVEGPDLMVVQMMAALRARADAFGQLPGDTRSSEQRLFDAANELLTVDAEGRSSLVPSVDTGGRPVTILVRGVEVSVLVPFSVAAGGDLEVAEIPGFGPILPSTARELLAHAEHVRRVSIDADSGQVIAVDDRIPGPARRDARRSSPGSPDHDAGWESEEVRAGQRDADDQVNENSDDEVDDDPDDGPEGWDDGYWDGGPTGARCPDPFGSADDPPEPAASDDPFGVNADGDPPGTAACPGALDLAADPHVDPIAPAVSPALPALLRRLVTDPVVHRDLHSTSYRVNGRIRRFLEQRDRTCTFPGCTVPGHWCDIDHREPWPIGPTNIENCHCLCRRHHRAKQAYFSVALDQRTGDTLWTTPDGRTYRRPPPTF